MVRTRDSDAPFTLVGEGELRRLARAGLVEWAEADGEAELMGILSPYYDDAQWNLDMVGAEGTFRRDWLGQGIRVGVLDSGINPHPDFGDRLLPGHNFIPDGDPEDTSDTFGHGTRIAGLIAGAGEDGYLGTAPEALLVPLKVTDGKSVKVSVLCTAIYSAIDDYGCRVLNLSMGVQTEYAALREAVAYAEEKGVIIVSAVGNNGSGTLYYPAGYDTVIGVGAVDENGALYRYSNHNAGVFLTAPGVDVRSTAREGGYILSTGTSFAVPQAAGAAAVLLGMDADLAPGRLRGILAAAASDCGEAGYDEYYGYGILNLGGSAAVLEEGKEVPILPAPDPWTACPRDETCPLSAFTDLTPAAWYHNGVHYALQQGIMKGVGEGTFQPEGSSSRAMVVTILWRLEGSPESAEDLTFRDVSPEAWYADAVRWAAGTGIVQGYDETSFGPNDPVTREQLAVILFRYDTGRGSEPEALAEPVFSDAASISPWAKEAVGWAVSLGILRGTADNLLQPGASATRAQTATMLMRYTED